MDHSYNGSERPYLVINWLSKWELKGKENSPETLVEGLLVLVEGNPGFVRVQTWIILN